MALLRPRQSFASSGEPFTVYIPEDGDTSGLDSVISSLSTQYGGLLGATTTAAGQATSTLAPGGSLTTGTTLATSISNGSFMTSRTGSSMGSSMPASMYSTTSSRASTAATASGSAGAGQNGLPARNTCTSPSCSSGLQAAIAIGILVAVFIIASVVILGRRNKSMAETAATRSAAPIRAQALEERAAPGSRGGFQSQNPGMSEINSGAPPRL